MSNLPAAAAPDIPETQGEKIFKVGTLSYTQHGLYVLFFWLMWNNFMMIFLQDPIGFGGFLQKDHGATNAEIAVFGTICSIIQMILNPVCSVWSDRTRTRWGRRRPYLALLTPPLAASIMAMPYMPTLHHYLQRFPWAASLLGYLPMNGPVFMLGICIIAIAFFNSITGTLFSYLYWDVVPQEVLGRWTAMTMIVSSAATFVWQLFFMRLADHHMKALCVGISLFSLSIYLLSIWKVKEGEYPPVDKHKKGGPVIASIWAYFAECFSDPFYLWIFAGFTCASINNATGGYLDFYLRYNLHLNFGSLGVLKAFPGLIAILLGYFFGSMTDRLHPIRVFAPSYFVLSAIYFGCFFFVHGQVSFLICSCLIAIGQFANGITYGALLPTIFPREKFGQFCSANALCASLLGIVIGIPLGKLFDLLHSEYRDVYLIAAGSMLGAGLIFLKVQRNYDARHGKIPVPKAG